MPCGQSGKRYAHGMLMPCRRYYRWLEIRHDDCTAKLPRGIRQYRAQVLAIAQMQMAIVRPGEGQRFQDVANYFLFIGGSRKSAGPYLCINL